MIMGLTALPPLDCRRLYFATTFDVRKPASTEAAQKQFRRAALLHGRKAELGNLMKGLPGRKFGGGEIAMVR